MKAKINKVTNNETTMPLIAMRGLVVFPNTVNQFDIGRERSIAAVNHAIKENSEVIFVTQRDVSVEQPTLDDLFGYGVVGEIKQVFRVAPDYIKVLVDCKYRAKLVAMSTESPFNEATVKRAPVRALAAADEQQAEALVRSIKEQLAVYATHYPKLARDIMIAAASAKNYGSLVEYLTTNIQLDFDDKQAILEEKSVIGRLSLFLTTITYENELLSYESELSDKVKSSIDRSQREYFLREQQRVISEELGEGDDTAADADEYAKKIKALNLPEQSFEKLQKEVSRLRKMQSFTQEASVIRTYLDTVLDLPWNSSTPDSFEISAARKKLEADHYGLKKVKERVLELLAVRSVTDKLNSQIICLVGPPGVGKTSVARSIAECMGRKYTRLSLGGVRDESEIRGHRKTYVGSMPGRIIAALISAKSKNPLILLDEIDKLGNDIKGDPASALLEVLDPEQNFDFKDHYIEIPFDLSSVLFITTANNPSSIPAPLYDRMEIIELPSYTRSEKFHIAKKHLLKKQMAKHALAPKTFTVSDKALNKIIDDYTAEAGVRALERCIAALCRKATAAIVEGKATAVHITDGDLVDYLDAPINRGSLVPKTDEIGSCNGLAWTSFGGEIAPLEVIVSEGGGKLELTGMLGEVMKESAKLAFTLARRFAEEYGYKPDFLSSRDIHIHAPQGAVKKDGPSAGVTLLTALVSALAGIPVDRTVAMTGEITLHGRILPIGGLKEKLIAAVKEKIATVLIPADNIVDLVEIDDEIKEKLQILPVSTVDEVLRLALKTDRHSLSAVPIPQQKRKAAKPSISS